VTHNKIFDLINEISVVRIFSNVRKNYSVVDGLSMFQIHLDITFTPFH
jgi:hypothetical protein